MHFSTPHYRFNQYDLWDEEKYAEEEPVFAVQSKLLNLPNLQRMATGQEKGYIHIEEFQSLKGLDVDILNTAKKGDAFYFEAMLSNNNQHSMSLSHVTKPVLAVMQNRNEIASVPLSSSVSQQKIKPGDVVALWISVPEEKIDADLPITFYTRTKENIRGEITSLKLN